MTYDLIKISGLPLVTPDSGQDIVVGVGDYAKRINYNAVKADMVGTSPSYTTDTEPYLMRQTAHTGVVGKCALDKLVGGSLGWNQLIKNGNFSNGTNDWTLGLLTATVSSNVITLTATGTQTAANINQTLSVPSGHKCFVSLSVNPSANNKIRYQLYDGSSFTGTTDITASASTWTAHQNIINCTLNAIQLYIRPNQNGVSGYSCQMKEVQIIDLTAEFGSTIADYIYSLESATAGAGVAWLSRYIDLGTYHAYDAGSIQSVQATAHVTTGFNQFDEVVEAGYWDVTTGQKVSGGNWMRCANYIPVLPNTEYKIHFTSGSGSQGSLIYLDGNKSVISYASSYISAVITTPSNCRYMVFYANSGWFGGNICINISKTSGTPKNGDYVPYSGHTYPLGSDALRGVPQLVSNKLAFDGDEKYPDGTIRRKYGIVDLGSLTWVYDTTKATPIFTAATNTINPPIKTNSSHMISGRHTPLYRFWDTAGNDKRVATGSSGLNISDSAYTTAEAFKSAMSSVYLVYELATESTESGTAYQKIQTIDKDGTEQFVCSSPVPVGHETQTPDNILAALEWLGE